MPTYSYRCPRCGHEYDRFQKITDDTRPDCPECGATGERVITGGAGLVFKGSGFYITDYKRAGEKKPESTDAPKKSAKEPAKPSAPSSGGKNAGEKS